MESGRKDAFEVAREALLGRYGTLDPDRMSELGADEVEVGAAVKIAERDSEGMAREKRIMLACPPTNINDLLEGMGVPPFVPTVGHSLTKCADCSTNVWIGPNQRAAAARAPQATLVLCMECAIVEQHKRGGGIVGHLGGGDGRPRLVR